MEEWTEEQWDDHYEAEEERCDETIKVLSLSKLGVLGSDYFNSFEWLSDFDKIKSDPFEWPNASYLVYGLEVEVSYNPHFDFETLWDERSEFEINEGLIESWRKLDLKRDSVEEFEIGHIRFPNLIELAYKNYYKYGLYPPPVLMKSIFKCFELYFEAKGELTLEEVFFGKVKKRSGSYSRRRDKDLRFIEFHYQLSRNNAFEENKMSAVDFARRLIRQKVNDEWDGPVDVLEEQAENFVRQYQRWKQENLNDK